MWLKYVCAVVLAAAVAAPQASSASGSDPLVGAMQQRYQDLRSFSGEFTQTLTHQESGSVEQRKGTLIFQKPFRLRWETVKPDPELLVVTEKEVWDYLPDEELAYRYSPEVVQDSRSVIQVITGQSRLDKDFSVSRQKDENGLAVLRLYPKEPTPQLVEAVLWIDPQSKLIRRAQITDFYSNKNDIVFTGLTPGADAPSGAFAFTPPPGITVEDLKDNPTPERPLLQ